MVYFIYFSPRSLILKDFIDQFCSVITRILIATIYQGTLPCARRSTCGGLFIAYNNGMGQTLFPILKVKKLGAWVTQSVNCLP